MKIQNINDNINNIEEWLIPHKGLRKYYNKKIQYKKIQYSNLNNKSDDKSYDFLKWFFSGKNTAVANLFKYITFELVDNFNIERWLSYVIIDCIALPIVLIALIILYITRICFNSWKGIVSADSKNFSNGSIRLKDMLVKPHRAVAYLLCIPFTSETKKFGTLNRKNDINNNRNKNLEKKCGGWWIVWGSIMLGYLLISLTIGPGALIGLVVLIPSLHFFTLKLNKSLEDFDKIKNKTYVNNNNTTTATNKTNDTKITRKELIKKTPFKQLINKFILLIFFNMVITLILAAAI
jgi:hypothetical protein